MIKKGKFIVCDGMNGAGKTTVMKEFVKFFENNSIEFIATREPGGTLISEKIREIILSNEHVMMDPITELLLFGASRAQHVREKIIPELENGKIVLCDRFDSATYAFQHYGRSIDIEIIDKINDLAIGGLHPDLTIILDLDPMIGLERTRTRNGEIDRLELENLDFQYKVREGYITQANLYKERFVVIDASKSINIVIEESIDAIIKVLNI